RCSFTLSSELSAALTELAQQQQATLFMTLLAAFQTLLHRYSGQFDILVGSTVTNRDRTEIQNLIGLFVNNLVFRAQVDAKLTFKDFLQRAKATALEAYAHQDVPFESVVDALQVDRQLSYNALFQVMFILHNTPEQSFTLPELKVTALELSNNAARFDLSLDMYQTAAGLTGVFEYSTDLFEAATIDRLVGHFETLLAGIVADPEAEISLLPILTTPELDTFAQWNNTQAEIPPVCAHQLIEAQVERTPEAIALSVGHTLPENVSSKIVPSQASWSYQQLNQQANRIARYLEICGAGHGSRIALALDRSADLVIVILAILKLGAIYIPLDPTYPTERLRHALQDAQATLLVESEGSFSGEHGAVVESLTNLRTVDLDKHRDQIGQQPKDNLSVSVSPEDTAYIIYTSGSTGKPKGIPICHRSLVNLLMSMAKTPGITADDALLAVTTVAFDIATLELLLLLTVGARVAIASTDTVRDASRLITQLANDNITVMQATPATWRLLIDLGWRGKSELKILCGGEALDLPLAQQLLPCCNELWNVYGPTETTIWSGARQITEDDLGAQTVPVGDPIDNTQFYVLDNNGQQVPIGIPGELHIGGAGLSQGYLNRSELTTEKFVKNCLDGHPVLYKTGDGVCYRPDGSLEYLGRLDHQIKLRGFRIEPGEIESVLVEQLGAEQALVMVRSAASGDDQLVAYYKTNDKRWDNNSLQRQLGQYLPTYMLPTAYVQIEEFPLTPNGKVDRNALPEPTIESVQEQTPPQTLTEQQMAELWGEVLNCSIASKTANFFELGGHSLLAARVIARIQPTFNVVVPLRKLFEFPSLEVFSQVIDAAGEPGIRIEPIDRNGDLPLSFAQQRQWVLAQLEPNSAFYNIPAAVRLEGDFSLELLKESLAILCQRHEGLRTGFKAVNGEAELFILPQAEPELVHLSLPDATEEAVLEQLQTVAQQPFDLIAPPLLRAQVIQTGPTTHIVALVLHHIIADAESVSVLVQELVSVYGQLQTQSPVTLSPLSIQYVDYASWQRTLETEQQLDYWQQQLADSLPLLPLPTDYPRPATQQFEGGCHRFNLTANQAETLQQLSQQHGATLFMTLLAAFKVLLHRYSRVGDIVVGTPISNRPDASLEGVLGMFVNTLALRSDLSQPLSFVQLLEQVKETALSAYANQDVPFEQVVDALEIPRNWSHSPLFQAMFVWRAEEPQQSNLADGNHALSWSAIPLTSNTTKVDLTLSMIEKGGEISGQFEYRQDLFRAETIQSMAEAFCTLLSGLTEAPEMKISALPLLPPRQRQLLAEWNKTARDYSGNYCLHHLFEQQVRQTPDATALIAENERLTYAELDARAEQLAGYLRSQHLTPESPVGICLDRSAYLIVAILAVLKAGGAYVPLDPAYPQSRLGYILEDAQISLLLTQQRYREMAALEQASCDVVLVDELEGQLPSESIVSTEENSPQPNNLAYIIYTSGSTGQPKGVAIEHRSPVTLVNWTKETFLQEQLAGVLASTSVCFDLSVFEIFVPLSSGGTVILAEDVLQLPELPAKSEVTLVNTVPTAIAELARIDGIPNSVTTINLAGEPIPPVLVQQLYTLPSVQQVYNLYGPSEDTTYSTCTLLSPEEKMVPIGRPIANTEAHVLDEHGSQVPIGMPGELYLAGDGVARGYLNRPTLTTERFITEFSGCQHQRAYRTGDLVRYRPDGQLDFLGRLDGQVKVRGFRIELGEIEAALLQRDDVIQAAARVWEQRLLAYVVLDSAADISTTETGVAMAPEAAEGLRSHLQQTLPNYMLPALFVPLKALPLLPNGKINRRALPDPVVPEPVVDAEISAPATEQQLMEIWQSLLQQPVGPNDNFFELGGDSILAIQAVSRAQQAGLHFSPRDLFQQGTVARLAAVANTQTSALASQQPVVGPVPLTPAQHWFFAQPLQQPHHWNQSVLLTVQQPLEPELLKKALQHLAEHHDVLRAYFESTELGWQQHYRPVLETLPVQIICKQTEDAGREITAIANDIQGSLNLATGPLWQVAYLEFETPKAIERRLLFVCHHLLVDGVSWRILLEDLQIAYAQLAKSGTAQLPPKTLSGKGWVEQLVIADYSAEREYWGAIAAAPVSQIPLDSPDGENTMASAKTISVTLPEDNTRRLLQDVPTVYSIRMDEVLLTALTLTLQPWAGDTLRIGLEGHGRPDDANLSRTVGWLTTLYPVLLSVSDHPGEALKAVKETLRSVPNQGLGYGVLQYLQSDDDLRNVIETPVRFNYLGQTDQLFTDSNWFAPATESSGAARSPHDSRDVLIEINAVISRQQLRLHWTYSSALHREETIANLTETYQTQLIALIDHCLSADTDQGYSPTDFPQMALAQNELDDLLGDLGDIWGGDGK
ncbi:MAG: amino acid adenylation domain-containing protein, partial [Cyanobacteria bacterium J06632_22]